MGRPRSRTTAANGWRRLLLVVTTLAVTLSVALSAGSAVAGASPAAPAAGGGRVGVGVRLLDRPSIPTSDPRAGIYVVEEVAPAGAVERRMEVSNDGDEPATVQLYPGAATLTGGTFAFGEGHAANELTGWTTVTPSEVALAPGQRVPVTITVAVPADAANGEREAVVWAQQVAAHPDAAGIVSVNRVGMRVYLSVGDGHEPGADFTIDPPTGRRGDDGRAVLEAIVHNRGERSIEAAGELRLDEGPGGVAAGPFPLEASITIEAGGQGTVRVSLDPALPDGPWQAHLTLHAAGIERAVSGPVTFAAGVGAPSLLASATAGPQHSGFPWLPTALVVVGSGAVFAALARRRRRSPTRPPA